MLLRFAGLYLVLWFVTAWVGAPLLGNKQHRAFIQAELGRQQLTLESLRERGDDPGALTYLEALYGSEVYDGSEAQTPRLQMRTSCPAPFVVRVEQEVSMGMLGSGWATTYLWIFGITFELSTGQTWIS